MDVHGRGQAFQGHAPSPGLGERALVCGRHGVAVEPVERHGAAGGGGEGARVDERACVRACVQCS